MKRLCVLTVVFYFLFYNFIVLAQSNPAKSVSKPKDDWDPEIHVRTQSSDELKIFILDVGQGDSIFLEFPYGETMLIDAGSHDDYGIPHVKYFLERYFSKNKYKDHTIDVVIASHPDLDHISGLKEILKEFNVNWFIDNGQPHSSKTYKSLMKSIKNWDKKEYTDYVAITEKEKDFENKGYFLLDDILNFNDCDCYILASYKGKGKQDKNNASLVLRAECGNSSSLFMGDAEGKNKLEEEEFLEANLKKWEENRIYKRLKEKGKEGLLEADVLKTGHHGSHHSSTEIFLEAVSPKVSVISTGDYRISTEAKDYGHPRSEHIERLEEHTTKNLSEPDTIEAFSASKEKTSLEIYKKIFLTYAEHDMKESHSTEKPEKRPLESYGDIFLVLKGGQVKKVEKNSTKYKTYFD